MAEMPYRVGFCMCCEAQILIRDSKRNWIGVKRNYREKRFVFDDGHIFKVPACAGCIDDLTYDKVKEKVFMVGSQGKINSDKQKILSSKKIDGSVVTDYRPKQIGSLNGN